jgi:hemerythrin-like metal-binding protein
MFSWQQELSVGVLQIDAQHKRLFELCAGLHRLMSAGAGRAALAPILEELIAYTRTHFRDEEKLMEQHRFPGREAHKALHEALTRQVLEFQQGFAAGKVSLSVQMLSFLKTWLVEHIGGNDRRVAAWLKERAA